MSEFNMDATVARRLLGVIPFASTDDTMPILNGVCLAGFGNELTIYATDRFKLARVIVPVDADLGEFRLTVNAKAFAAALKAVTPTRGRGGRVIIETSDEIVRITDGVQAHELSVIDGNYPPMEQFFETDANYETDSVCLAPAAFKALADAARGFGKNAASFELRFTGPHKPVRAIMPLDDDARFDAVIMPIRRHNDGSADTVKATPVDAVSDGEVDRLNSEIDRLKAEAKLLRSEIELLTADNVRLKSDNDRLEGEKRELAAQLSERIASETVAPKAVAPKTVAKVGKGLRERLAAVRSMTPKMVDRALMAVDRGDSVDSVLMYALGTVDGKRAMAVRKVIEG